ncbi:hypothetical protein GF371_03600 [Candidatus Woesearchaeota archaeon]|nr:hypothetical protein [Candidatus Woesearchaeota archaeon]
MAVRHSLKKVSKETVVSILREYLSKGHDMKFIEKALLKAECPKKILREAKKELKIGLKTAKKVKKGVKPKKAPKTTKKPSKPKLAKPRIMPTPAGPPRVVTPPKLPKVKLTSKKVLYPLIIILACIAVLLIVLLLFSIGPENCGTDEACFIAKANACEPARFHNMIDTTEISYVIGEDCTVTKEITKLGEREPEEVKELFLGQAMKCSYPKGGFDRVYIDEISGKLETCEGPLATIIAELRR